MTKLVAEQSFWDLFPDAAIGAVVVRGMRHADEVSEADQEAISQMLARANREADQYLTSNTISQNEVVAVWRDAYRRFKTKKGARCSIEALLKRVLKGNPVGHITPSVDIYNAISLTYAFPVGGMNSDAFEGDVRLRITEGGDAFRPIGEDDDDPTLPGELCYLDDAGAICRCLNWRDGVRTCLSDESRNALLIMECVDPQRVDALREAVDELAASVNRYLGGEIVEKRIITKDEPELVIS